MAKKIENEFQRMRVAYDLYGFVKISNSLDLWQVDALENSFDSHYKTHTGFTPSETPDRLPALNGLLEQDYEALKIVSSATYVMKCIDAIAGADCQYIASDILLVYDDSIGAHRDTLYDFDAPKILIFLSDCIGEETSVPEAHQTASLAGSFAVLSGSQYPDSTFNNLAAQLSDWPGIEQSVRQDVTPHFLRGDTKENGEYLYPYFDYDSRYQGYSYIPFKRGDVVIFSTRALHALLPTYSKHFSKLVGIIFLEGYSKFAGRQLNSDISQMNDNELSYLSIPYSLRVADQILKNAGKYQEILEAASNAMGLVDELARKDPLVYSVFEPKTTIYRILSKEAETIKKHIFENPSLLMNSFYKNSNKQSSSLEIYHNRINPSELLKLGQVGEDYSKMATATASEFISKLQAPQLSITNQEVITNQEETDISFRSKISGLRYIQKIKSILKRFKKLMLSSL